MLEDICYGNGRSVLKCSCWNTEEHCTPPHVGTSSQQHEVAFSGFLLSLQPHLHYFSRGNPRLFLLWSAQEMDWELVVNAAPQPKGWLQTAVRPRSQTKSLD